VRRFAANKTTTLLRSKENGLQLLKKKNQVPEIENFIKPYRDINNDLDSILCPETLDKSTGKWQTTIGNLMADVTLSRETLFFNPEKKEYRYLFTEQRRYSFDTTKGNVTARTALKSCL
jgi:hypothetical protein